MLRRRDRGQAPSSGEPPKEAAPIPLHHDTEPGPSPGSSEALRRQNGKWKVVVSLLAIGFFLYMALEWRDVVVWVEGRWVLNPKRQRDMDEQIKSIGEAEQYVLLTGLSGFYDCYLCKTKSIFLNSNEVWRYGVTSQGEKTRYTGGFVERMNLLYVIQFTGHYAECLIEEKKKLFLYPLLPENVARPDSIRLVLPPGNFQVR